MRLWVVGAEVERAEKWGSMQDNGLKKISQDRYGTGIRELAVLFRWSTQNYVYGIRKGEKES